MKPNRIISMAMALAASVAVSACASNGVQRAESQAANLRAYADAAGPPINSFAKVGANLQSWEAYGDDTLVVYSTPRRAYLLNVSACPGLDYTTMIRVSDSMGQIQRNFDRVYPMDRGNPFAQAGCPILSIREIDLDRYKLLRAPFQMARPE